MLTVPACSCRGTQSWEDFQSRIPGCLTPDSGLELVLIRLWERFDLAPDLPAAGPCLGSFRMGSTTFKKHYAGYSVIHSI